MPKIGFSSGTLITSNGRKITATLPYVRKQTFRNQSSTFPSRYCLPLFMPTALLKNGESCWFFSEVVFPIKKLCMLGCCCKYSRRHSHSCLLKWLKNNYPCGHIFLLLMITFSSVLESFTLEQKIFCRKRKAHLEHIYLWEKECFTVCMGRALDRAACNFHKLRLTK